MVDIEPGIFNQGCFGVSKLMMRLLRHDVSVHREEDGAVRFVVQQLVVLGRSMMVASRFTSPNRSRFFVFGTV